MHKLTQEELEQWKASLVTEAFFKHLSEIRNDIVTWIAEEVSEGNIMSEAKQREYFGKTSVLADILDEESFEMKEFFEPESEDDGKE